MKNILIIFTLFLTAFGYSQTAVKKSSIDSGGTTTTSGSTSVVYTIGEVAIQENTQGNTHVSEGFIGPDLRQSLGITDEVLFNDFKAFPNPTADMIHINFSKSSDYTMQVSDMNGKILLVKNTNQPDNTLDISSLARGVYLLLLKDTAKHAYNILKIEKK